jgi:hypothetical protein
MATLTDMWTLRFTTENSKTEKIALGEKVSNRKEAVVAC